MDCVLTWVRRFVVSTTIVELYDISIAKELSGISQKSLELRRNSAFYGLNSLICVECERMLEMIFGMGGRMKENDTSLWLSGKCYSSPLCRYSSPLYS